MRNNVGVEECLLEEEPHGTERKGRIRHIRKSIAKPEGVGVRCHVSWTNFRVQETDLTPIWVHRDEGTTGAEQCIDGQTEADDMWVCEEIA